MDIHEEDNPQFDSCPRGFDSWDDYNDYCNQMEIEAAHDMEDCE